ncbi:plasminogen-like [Mizuhopecten yessoensis]|uniref:plasminogen-like n=1 Tax=Mizuhopecten yessoensis TaxID=6573 RepID=UPI000B45A2AD|nr:plasminogen-like [Mizuhopecten yessoensis]
MDACQSVPVPAGYSLEYPYHGSSVRAKYSCTTNTDQPPVDHCPVVSCDGQHNLTPTPASCSANTTVNPVPHKEKPSSPPPPHLPPASHTTVVAFTNVNSVKEVFNSSLSEYEGGVTCTVRGVTCQRWDTNYPHTPNYLAGRSDLGNRCRVESEQRPWCYTTDPEMRWDFSAVQDIHCGAPPTILTPSNMTEAGISTEWPYRGSYALACYQCTSLTTGDPVSSCPVTLCDGNLMWSKANLSCSVKDCYNVTSLTYNGRVSCTEHGITCQRWDTNEPHSHWILSGRSDLENWCQIGEEEKPWCYTTNPHFRWQYCPVEECP